MTQALDTLETSLARLWRSVDKALLGTVLAASAFFMALAHGFAFANLFPTHDATVVVYDAQWTMYVLGRWAQNLYYPLVRGKIAAPWLIGFCAAVYVGLAGYFAARLLALKKPAAVLLTGLLATCASVTTVIATYTMYTDAFLFALLLACFGAFCVVRGTRVGGLLAGAVCFCGCMALYQAYIQFAVGLFLLVLLGDAVRGTSWKAWLLRGVRDLAALAVGGVLYAASVWATLTYTGYRLADTGNGMQQLFSLGPAAVLEAIPAAWADFFKVLLASSDRNDRAMRAATALLLLLTVYGLCKALRGRGKRAAAQAVICLLLLPLGLNFVYILTSGNVHILMQHAAFLVYALPLALAGGTELTPARLTRRLLTAALCLLLIWRSVVCANGAYVYTKLVYENTTAKMQGILADVGALDGYEDGVTPIAFVGDFTDSEMSYRDAGFSRYADGDLLQKNSAVTYDGTIRWFCEHILGSDAKIVDQQAELEAWAENDTVKAMPSYPAKGYCAIVDGTAVVKISD